MSNLRRPFGWLVWLAGLGWLFFLAVGGGAQELRLLHINDWHGWNEPAPPRQPTEVLGGVAALAYQLNLRRQEKPSLLLAAGDMLQGSVWANYTQGQASLALLNALGVDAMVVGNHEFDFGLAALEARIREARFPILGANVQGVAGLRPWVLQDIAGVRLAIIGVVTPQTPTLTTLLPQGQVRFLPPALTVAQYLPQVRPQVDLVVVLSHLGLAGDRQLAREVKGIDLIVGGHSHSRLESGERVGATLIVQAWEHGKTLGIVDLKVRSGRIEASRAWLEAIPATGPQDPVIQQLVVQQEAALQAALSQVVGQTAAPLAGEQIRSQETPLGNWLADVARAATGAEVAILNSGGIRGSLPAGPIQRRQLYELLPYENHLITLRVSGRTLRQVLEHGLSALPRPAGRFLQVSGLVVRFAPSAPPGRRLVSVEINGRPLRDQQHYTLTTVDFLAGGGDGYGMLASHRQPGNGAMVGSSAKPFREIVSEALAATEGVVPPPLGRLLPAAENGAKGRGMGDEGGIPSFKGFSGGGQGIYCQGALQ